MTFIYLWCKLVHTSIRQCTRQYVNGTHTHQWHTRLLPFTFTVHVCVLDWRKNVYSCYMRNPCQLSRSGRSRPRKGLFLIFIVFRYIYSDAVTGKSRPYKVDTTRFNTSIDPLYSFLFFRRSFSRCTLIFALIWCLQWGLTRMTCFGIITCFISLCAPPYAHLSAYLFTCRLGV